MLKKYTFVVLLTYENKGNFKDLRVTSHCRVDLYLKPFGTAFANFSNQASDVCKAYYYMYV